MNYQPLSLKVVLEVDNLPYVVNIKPYDNGSLGKTPK